MDTVIEIVFEETESFNYNATFSSHQLVTNCNKIPCF